MLQTGRVNIIDLYEPHIAKSRDCSDFEAATGKPIISIAVADFQIRKANMCGRFTNRLTWREIVALYRLAVPVTPERNLPARYNICPTDAVDVVVERGGQVDLVPMRWGLIPSWWQKTAKEVPATFNARAETLGVKPKSLSRKIKKLFHQGPFDLLRRITTSSKRLS
jgi:SOS response associated peptidase (SRAP)